MFGCPRDIPARQVSTGTLDQLGVITASFGFIRYDTTNHNLEVYEENGWKDIVINDKTNIDISGKLIINDVSINKTLEVNDASFNNIGAIDGSLVVLGDLSVNGQIFSSGGSFNAHLSAVDASFQNNVDISGKLVVDGDVSFNAHLSATDASFHKDVTVVGNLYVDGSFNFGEVIQNITTVNNELLISTQVDISNHGTGPALKVSQYGDGADDKLAVFDAGEQGPAFEIMYDGDSVFHKDVSFQNNVDIRGKLLVDGDLNLNMSFYGKEVLLAGAGALNGTGGAQGIATAIATAPVTDAGYSSHNAFNGTLADIHDAWYSDNTPLGIDNPKSLIFEFPYDVIITKYKIWPRTTQPYNPKAWTLRAYPVGRMYPPTRNFTGMGNSISTKTISGQAYGNGHYQVNQSTMYLNSSSNAGWNAFSGIAGTDVHFNNGYYTTGSYNQVYNRYLVTGYYGDWLTIELPDPINLTKYGFKQRESYADRAPGRYKIYGSNDGSAWTELVHKTSTITYTGEDFEESISTTGKYKYFGVVVNQLYGTGQQALNFEAWYIYGNEDNPVEIHDVSGVTNWPTPTSESITNDTSFNEYRVFNEYPVTNTTTAYRKFELNITESSNATYVTIGQLAFYVYKHTGGNLVVNGDVSLNAHLSAVDASFQNDVDVGGNITFSDSTVQNTSSAVLEYISSYCDGTIISVKNPINVGGGSDGTIRPAVVPGIFYTYNSWQLITGSNIIYCPPPGTTLVIYEFNFQSRPKNNHKIMSIRFKLNGTELQQARQGASNYDHATTGQSTFHNIKVPINVTSVNNNWSSAIDLRCEVYSYSSSHRATIHQSAYWQTGGGLFVKPSITLIAIKQ